MNLLARFFAWLKRPGGLEPGEVLVGDGFVFVYRSFHLPHGRSITARLRCLDGTNGLLTVRSRPARARKPDITSTHGLTGEALAAVSKFLDLSGFPDRTDPIMDGWRTRMIGVHRGGGWQRRFVIGAPRSGELVERLQRLDAFLLAGGDPALIPAREA